MARSITIPGRSSLGAVLGRQSTSRVAITAVVLAVILYPFVDPSTGDIDVAVYAFVNVLLALGLNVVVGYAGLLDLGYGAFFAIGAYSLAMLASAHFAVNGHSVSNPLLSFGPNGIHVAFFLMIPIAALVAASFGVLFGAPTLRLRGDYLAIVTLGFGEIVPKAIANLGPDNSFGWPDITGGVNRITGIDSPPDLHVGALHASFQGSDLRPWYFLGFFFIVLTVIIISSLRRSRLGRAWSAIREDEIAAAHMGVNITRTRLLAFGLGAAFSGFAGVLEASRIGSIDYTQFSFDISIRILVMVILGGMGSIPGVMLGAIIISYLDLTWLQDINNGLHQLGVQLHAGPSVVGDFGTWLANVNLASAHPLIFGLILLLIMLLRPQGLWPSKTRARELRPETARVLAEENQDLYATRSEPADG
ncbi:MAG: branched-chain amino acid ABC transporter permease [Chloroflexota bacterium]|nr:MAG: ABC transporter ATP-binding protein [Chloroflexota bacterium]